MSMTHEMDINIALKKMSFFKNHEIMKTVIKLCVVGLGVTLLGLISELETWQLALLSYGSFALVPLTISLYVKNRKHLELNNVDIRDSTTLPIVDTVEELSTLAHTPVHIGVIVLAKNGKYGIFRQNEGLILLEGIPKEPIVITVGDTVEYSFLNAQENRAVILKVVENRKHEYQVEIPDRKECFAKAMADITVLSPRQNPVQHIDLIQYAADMDEDLGDLFPNATDTTSFTN